MTVKDLYELYYLELEAIVMLEYKEDSLIETIHDFKSKKFGKGEWDKEVEHFYVLNGSEHPVLYVMVK